jgi:hypothetical protein
MAKINKLILSGSVFVVLGIVSGIIQNTYYEYVDANGILHDSLFLPLSFLLVALGSIFLLFGIIRFLNEKINSMIT